MISLYTSLDDVLFNMVFATKEDLVKYIRLLGIEAEDQCSVIYCRRDGFVSGFHINTDPTTKAAMLGYIILGEQWTLIVPKLLKKVNDRWAEQAKEARDNGKDSG